MDSEPIAGYLDVPSGARIHQLRMRVNHGCDLQEAVNAAGPDTSQSNAVHKISSMYPPIPQETEGDYVLFNLPRGGGYKKALAWALANRLNLTEPREALAVGAHCPELREVIDCNPVFVVATTECLFGGIRRLCFSWWIDSGRGASLRPVGYFGQSVSWFLFRK